MITDMRNNVSPSTKDLQEREISVQLKGVSKIYPLKKDKPTFFEKIVSNGDAGKFVALNDLNLNIYKGEKIGIIGHNGSGKTTILKIISSITIPSSGSVKTVGKVISLIELAAGFHPEMTGRENIYLNGLIIGMSKFEIKNEIENIVDFADIGDFINHPLYTYSEGMKLRLGFSIAIHASPDILILDEAILAGDYSFQNKSGEKIKELFKNNKTVIIVSHWREYLEKHCERIILLEKGKIIEDGGLEVIDSIF